MAGKSCSERALGWYHNHEAIILFLMDSFIFLPVLIFILNKFFSSIFLFTLASQSMFILVLFIIVLTLIFKVSLHNVFAFEKNDFEKKKLIIDENSDDVKKGLIIIIEKETPKKFIHKLLILLHRNSFVPLWRFLLIFAIFLVLSFYNSPPYLIADPTSITENATFGKEINSSIILENIGSELEDIVINHYEYRYGDQENSWLNINYKFKELYRGNSEFVLVTLNTSNLSRNGKYRGIIYINAVRKESEKNYLKIFPIEILGENVNITIPVTLNMEPIS